MIRVRRPFLVAGPIPRSKSWLNRALILKSLRNDLRILDWEPSDADGDDVVHLSRCLNALSEGATVFHIGESGTGLRFLLSRLAIETGVFRVIGSSRLLQRPHGVLFDALQKLGATVRAVDATTLEICATGGPTAPTRIEVDSSESSQFASSLLLVSLGIKSPLEIVIAGEPRSTGYFEMTKSLVEGVRKGRKVLVPEADASTVATLATIAVASGTVLRRRAVRRLASHLIAEEEAGLKKVLSSLEDLVQNTQQPDRSVFDILRKSGTPSLAGSARVAAQSSPDQRRGSMNVDLSSAPDLFPVLSALSVFSEGTSTFSGAPHLRLKESDRITGVSKLLNLVGVKCVERPDGLVVHGASDALIERWSKLRRQGLSFEFGPESDHRLAFAAAVLAAGGVPIEVMSRGVVGKSFPQFWSMIEGDAPRVALIGHRGAGKTEAARRWARGLGPHAIMIDLDREIERLAGRSVQEIFDQKGEAEFRWFEREAWREVDSEIRSSLEAVIVSCGGGFDPSQIDDSWIRTWIRRSTDADGRIFLDRPRLNPKLGPLEESKARWSEREPRFRQNSDRCFETPEGVSARSADPSEKLWVEDLLLGESAIHDIGGTVTLRSHQNVKETCERLLRWGVARIEVRDDFFPPSTEPDVWNYLRTLSADRFLVSFRKPGEVAATSREIDLWISASSALGLAHGLAVDWSLDAEAARTEVSLSEAGPPDEILSWAKAGQISLILSYHNAVSSDGSISATSSSLEAELTQIEVSVTAKIGRPVVVKLALLCSDFKTLQRFHSWAVSSKSTRVFLPMTPEAGRVTARWTWYRLLRSLKETPLQLGFWREDDGSSLDQPTFSAWWRRRQGGANFAAILGAPVHASQTPMYHNDFFAKRGMWVAAIHISRDEVTQALPFLFELGLRAAAVTSPLKNEIVSGQSINTLVVPPTNSSSSTSSLASGVPVTTSTDDRGFEKLWISVQELAARMGLSLDIKGERVAVWGGGGVLSALKKVIPNSSFFSASMGELRSGDLRPGDLRSRSAPDISPAPPDQQNLQSCEIVVWASGQERGQWPATFKPRIICDLSYMENSTARAVAIETGARYVSGLEMFYAQAEAQQEFWSMHLPVTQELK